MSNGKPRTSLIVVVGILFECGLGGVAWALGWVFGQPVLDSFHWNVAAVALGAAATVPMLLLFLACLHCPIGPMERIRQFSEEVIRPLFVTATVPQLALLALAAGLGEEMLFRGFLQACLVRWTGTWPGVGVASIVFGLLHFITPTYAVLASLLGLYLGWLYLGTGNLLPAVVAHALYDFLALLYLLRPRVGDRTLS
jgi:membrane protease YdiL (CAAX protease family)